MQWLAIGLGAALGACLRAWLGSLNTPNADLAPVLKWLPFDIHNTLPIPIGTLIANVLGGLLIGIALVVFLRFGDSLHPNIKLFIITGFLGGLTTFSSFSAEVFTLLNSGRLGLGLGLVGLHVILTLFATAIGFYVMRAVLS